MYNIINKIFPHTKYIYLSEDDIRYILQAKSKNLFITIINDKYYNIIQSMPMIIKRKNCLILKDYKQITIFLNINFLNSQLRHKQLKTLLNQQI